MPNIFPVRPADIVLFWDDRFPAEEAGLRPSAGDVNCVAVIVGEQGALFIGKSIFGRRIERIPLAVISSLKNVQMRRTHHGHLEKEIAAYFLAHSHSPSAFKAGLVALREDNLSPFHQGTLFPKRPRYKTADEHEQAWASLVATLKPMDAIFTVDTHSVVSKFIAWATRGSWSHVASYLGEGEITEVVTTGMRRVPLATYKRPQYRVAAAYRCSIEACQPRESIGGGARWK